MKVILLDNIKGVGRKDDIIEANDGYARNFLIPKGKAVEANNANLSKLRAKQSSNEHKLELEKQDAEKIKEKLSDLTLEIKVKVGENGKIFGGVTSKEIADNLKVQKNIDIDKKKIVVKETIKNIGVQVVDIKLFPGIIGKLKIKIMGE
jgi:large subunit ribosomal protein L9